MKKTLLCCLLLVGTSCLWAQSEVDEPGATYRAGAENRAENKTAFFDPEENTMRKPEEKRVRNRGFEYGMLGINVDASNNFVTAAGILRETAQINLDDIMDGLALHAGLRVSPLSFQFNKNDQWGVGFAVNLETTGNIAIPGSVLKLSQGKKTFGAGAAAFLDVSIPVFFHYRDFKIKIKPSGYVPLVYAEPGIIYQYQDFADGARISIDYDMYMYSAVSLIGIDSGNVNVTDMLNTFDIKSVGYDFGLGVEYPLYYWLDVGIDLTNVPVPWLNARMSHYMHLAGSAYMDTRYISLVDIAEGNDFPDEAFGYPEKFEPDFGESGAAKNVFRPFKWMFYANYRPYDSRIFQFIPSLGFSISPLYAQKGSIEGGVSARATAFTLKERSP